MTLRSLLSLILAMSGIVAAGCAGSSSDEQLATATPPTAPETLAAVEPSSDTSTTPSPVPIDGASNQKPSVQVRLENLEALSPSAWQCVEEYLQASGTTEANVAQGAVDCDPDTLRGVVEARAEQDGAIAPMFDVRCLFDLVDENGSRQPAAAQVLLSFGSGPLPPVLLDRYRVAAPTCAPGWLLGDIAEEHVPIPELGLTPETLSTSIDPSCVAQVAASPSAESVWESIFEALESQKTVDWADPAVREVQAGLLDCVDVGKAIGGYARNEIGLELEASSLLCLRDGFNGPLLLASVDPTIETIENTITNVSSCLSEEDLAYLGFMYELELTRSFLDAE